MNDQVIRWWVIAAFEITLLATAPFLIHILSQLP